MRPNCKACVHSKEGFAATYCKHPDARVFDRVRGYLPIKVYDYFDAVANKKHLKRCDDMAWFQSEYRERKNWLRLWRTN